MKKIFLSLTVILTFIFYSLHQRFESSDETTIVTPPSIRTTTPEQTNTPITNNTPAPPIIQPVSEKYKNGVYTGDVTDAYYGLLQVKVIIAGSKIADVQFLQYPNDRRTSIEINTQAMPYLKQEAIQAQNANVDIVSGATQTSKTFIESLQSALDKAKV